jgi:hypothetical protein
MPQVVCSSSSSSRVLWVKLTGYSIRTQMPALVGTADVKICSSWQHNMVVCVVLRGPFVC